MNSHVPHVPVASSARFRLPTAQEGWQPLSVGLDLCVIRPVLPLNARNTAFPIGTFAAKRTD